MLSNPISAGSLPTTKSLLPLTTRPFEHLQRHRLIRTRRPIHRIKRKQHCRWLNPRRPPPHRHAQSFSRHVAGSVRPSARVGSNPSILFQKSHTADSNRYTNAPTTDGEHAPQPTKDAPSADRRARRHQLRQSPHLTLQTIQLITSTTRLPQHSEFRRSQHIDRGYINPQPLPRGLRPDDGLDSVIQGSFQKGGRAFQRQREP
jgi:hypothetical protein